jgi:glycosyltransferase involved in cell wall biosynthesis
MHPLIINAAEMGGPSWTFLKDEVSQVLGSEAPQWRFVSGVPKNAIERRITKPEIGRYRAAVEVAVHAALHPEACVISHLPTVTASTSIALQAARQRRPHLAYSFTFTSLPDGLRRRYMARAFSTVDRFVVYTDYERRRNAEWFDLDVERLDYVPWAMETPSYSDRFQNQEGQYISAVGGEGRDYGTLFEAMKLIPQVKLIVVARPFNLRGLNPPNNVEVHTQLPADDFWSVVRHARFSAVPLLDDKVCCGHASMVGAYQLGRTMVTTYSEGTAEYATDGDTARVVPPRDASALAQQIAALWEDEADRRRLEGNAQRFVDDNCTPMRMAEYLCRSLDTLQVQA